MAQIVIKKENVQKISVQEAPAIDCDLHLYSLWLHKMAPNPGLYLDAKVIYGTGNCPCKCTGNLYLLEVRKHK
jgi:hypothetical protein